MNNPGIKCRDLNECIRLATADCDAVVELGCGFGDRLRLVNATVRVGIDAHEPYIHEARQRHPEMRDCFLVRDAAAYIRGLVGKFRFDAVLMVDFLEHLATAEAVELIRDCQRAAKRIVLWVPLGNHPQTADPYQMGGDHWQTHRSTWEASDLEALGFNVKVWPTVPNRPGIEPRAAFCVW